MPPRAGLSFVRLDPRARAIRIVCSLEVNVIQLHPEAEPSVGGTLMACADNLLAMHGWDRVVQITDGNHHVGLYAEVESPSSGYLKSIAVVYDVQRIVSACLCAEATPLLALL
ncbi:MAG: hypothetical protein N3G20_12350 [Verrucomicrobiae bacterium]|nr:hypothetical protein [Verrucomicrobiae bacterium]